MAYGGRRMNKARVDEKINAAASRLKGEAHNPAGKFAEIKICKFAQQIISCVSHVDGSLRVALCFVSLVIIYVRFASRQAYTYMRADAWLGDGPKISALGAESMIVVASADVGNESQTKAFPGRREIGMEQL